MNPPDPTLCQCAAVHGPPLFFCGGKLAAGETICAWCKSGHDDKLKTLGDLARSVGLSLKFWARRTFR